MDGEKLVRYVGYIKTDSVVSSCEFEFEASADTPNDQLEELAREAAFNYVEWSFEPATDIKEQARIMEWQPIETAPDETDVIVADPDRISGEFYISVAWRHAESGKWWRPHSGPSLASYIMPTHWMPLPSPPTIEE